MPISIKPRNEDGVEIPFTLNTIPDICANCGKHGQPDFVTATVALSRRILHAIFRCPVSSCRGLYVAMYGCSNTGGNWRGQLTGSGLARFVESKEFQQNVATTSPAFCEIFNQARIAEENGLNHICGPGYRKALEFLIKDFLIEHKFKGDAKGQEQIKKTFLGPVIEDYVDDERIKRCAKRATWLGNDETHYIRKWEDKDLADLKALILLTVNFIDSSIEAERYFSDMSDPKSS